MTSIEYLKKLYPTRFEQYKELFEAEPTTHKPTVTLTDLEDKYLERYFVQSVTDLDYIIEVDIKQFETLKNNPRFTTVSVIWRIVGTRKTIKRDDGSLEWGTEEINKQAILAADLTMKGLAKYITDYSEFWRGE